MTHVQDELSTTEGENEHDGRMKEAILKRQQVGKMRQERQAKKCLEKQERLRQEELEKEQKCQRLEQEELQRSCFDILAHSMCTVIESKGE